LLDHGDLSWQAYLPDDDFAGKIWQTQWGKPSQETDNMSTGGRGLVLDGFNGDENCEYWGDQEKNHWLGVFEFCKRRFTANATYGGEALDLKGHLVHYVYRRSTEKEANDDPDEDTERTEVASF
jgi:hypothetical protein